jgi:hypothetical protein
MFAVQQFPGTGVRPQQYQYGTVSGYYPLQTTGTDLSSMMSAFMPMIMMVMMLAMLMPMMKGMTGAATKG